MSRKLRWLVAPAVAGALMLTAQPASAEPSPPGCDRGAWCAYSGMYHTGTLKIERHVNWSGSVSGVGSVFNNGVAQPGVDHIQLYFNFPGYPTQSICLHYNPGPGAYEVNFGSPVTITRVTWRGEC